MRSVGKETREELKNVGHGVRRVALPTREEQIERSKNRQAVLKERAQEKKYEEQIAASDRKIAVSKQTKQKAQRSMNGTYFGMPDPEAFLGVKRSSGGFGGGQQRQPFDLLNMGSGGSRGPVNPTDNLLNLGGGSGGGPPPMDTREFFYGRQQPGGGMGGGGGGMDINEFYFGKRQQPQSGGKKGGKPGGKTGNPFNDMYGL